MRVSARRRGWCHPRGTPTRVPVVTMGTKAGATTDANDDDPPVSLTWTPRHFEPRILPMDICRGMRDRGTRAWDSPFILYGTDVVHDRRHRARRRRPRARRLANPRSTARVAPRAVRNWPRPFTRARGVRHTRGVMTHEKLLTVQTGARRQSLLDGIFIHSKVPATPRVSRRARSSAPTLPPLRTAPRRHPREPARRSPRCDAPTRDTPRRSDVSRPQRPYQPHAPRVHS